MTYVVRPENGGLFDVFAVRSTTTGTTVTRAHTPAAAQTIAHALNASHHTSHRRRFWRRRRMPLGYHFFMSCLRTGSVMFTLIYLHAL